MLIHKGSHKDGL